MKKLQPSNHTWITPTTATTIADPLYPWTALLKVTGHTTNKEIIATPCPIQDIDRKCSCDGGGHDRIWWLTTPGIYQCRGFYIDGLTTWHGFALIRKGKVSEISKEKAVALTPLAGSPFSRN